MAAPSGLDVLSQVQAQGNMALELDRIRDAAERAARAAGVEVVDIEWKVGRQRVLRVFVDKPADRSGEPFGGAEPPRAARPSCRRERIWEAYWGGLFGGKKQ